MNDNPKKQIKSISPSELLELIEDEYNKHINELGLCHRKGGSGDGGEFTSCDTGTIYSLSKKPTRAQEAGVWW